MCLAAARVRDGEATLRNSRVAQQGAKKVSDALVVLAAAILAQGIEHVAAHASVRVVDQSSGVPVPPMIENVQIEVPVPYVIQDHSEGINASVQPGTGSSTAYKRSNSAKKSWPNLRRCPRVFA